LRIKERNRLETKKTLSRMNKHVNESDEPEIENESEIELNFVRTSSEVSDSEVSIFVLTFSFINI